MFGRRRPQPSGCGSLSVKPSSSRRSGRGLLRALAVLPLAGLLSGCNYVLLAPSGDIAKQQSNLLIVSTLLMLLIIVPVILFTFLFAWHYRANNQRAVYDPEWNHSTRLEVLIWSAPLVIIIALGAITWLSTHTLDPYRKLMRVDAGRPVSAAVPALNVQVVSLDWKWLFFYPDYGIATVNEMAAPVNVPINFRLTGTSVMNAFFVPALAGMIYTMPGMQTQLHAVMNKEGEYDGYSGNYSGSGYTRMHFRFLGVQQQNFEQWVAKVKAEGKPLDRTGYLVLEQPSEQEPVRYYASVENGLYDAILNMCVRPGKLCANQMMSMSAKGGSGGHEAVHGAQAGAPHGGRHASPEQLEYDSLRLQQGHDMPGATTPASGRPSRSEEQPEGMQPDSLSPGIRARPTEQAGGHAGHGAAGAPPAAAPANRKIQVAPPQLGVSLSR